MPIQQGCLTCRCVVKVLPLEWWWSLADEQLRISLSRTKSFLLLLVTGATLVVTSALLVVTKKLLELNLKKELIANIVTTSKALVTTSKAPVPSSVALKEPLCFRCFQTYKSNLQLPIVCHGNTHYCRPTFPFLACSPVWPQIPTQFTQLGSQWQHHSL